jgi:two-component system sensor histidine kinase AlgZ
LQVTANNKLQRDFFLPDFCSLNSVFAVVVLSQLFAFILTLASAQHSSDLWYDLGMISLFMQWAGLSCAALLCALRPWLSRFNDTIAGLLSYLLLLLVIVLLSEGAWWVGEQGQLSLVARSHLDFLLRNLTIGAIVSALALRYFYVQSQWRRGIRAESQARLQALQARIRPHFLFNSINTISSLIHPHPAQAEEALLDLADLFRANLREERKHIPLLEELALSRQYLHMEGLRLGERLQLDWQVDAACESLLIPPLILQPLVENAVYHGIEPLAEGGTVQIRVSCDALQLQLRVLNPLPPSAATLHHGNHLALENIAQRLQVHYGNKARLQQRTVDGQFEVVLTLPRESAA